MSAPRTHQLVAGGNVPRHSLIFVTAVSLILAHTQDGRAVLLPEDRTYFAQVAAARAGISQPAAERLVDSLAKQNDAQDRIREAPDAARKRAAQLSIMLAL